MNKFFLDFARKTLYWQKLCAIMNEVDGQEEPLAPSEIKNRSYYVYSRKLGHIETRSTQEHEEEKYLWQQSGFICSAKVMLP